MDPVTAVGLASGILTFIEAGLKLVKTAHEIHNSVDGVLDENKHRESVADEVRKAASRLENTRNSGLSPERQALCSLAKKCRETSSELMKVLDKVKPKPGSSNALKLVTYAVKANRRVGEVRQLEGQLNDYRDQLTLAIVELSRVEATNGFEKLLNIVKSNDTKLESLTQSIDHLRQAHLSLNSSPAVVYLEQLLTVDSQARCVLYQDLILESLKFEGMYNRYDAIHSAHDNTFEWIYQPVNIVQSGGSCYDSDELREARRLQHESREKFISWLSSEVSHYSFFHISGKLGSGKSTLMKYLCGHSRTKEHLNKWAGHKKLAFATFFFWRHGTAVQKSLAGLCRSLLYDVLKQRPDLIPDTFPETWSGMRQTSWTVNNKVDMSISSIKDALHRLLQNPQLYDKHRFCIFIDGLDEFEPGLEDGLDHLDLVHSLRQWTVEANRNLKLCVSSREEGVFMDEYMYDPSFRLQDLTRFDMQDYVRSRLGNLKNKSLMDRFVHVIPQRSSGIFLWVYLVVRTIRTKISHRVSDEALKKHLEGLPEGLKALFLHVLENLDPSDRIWTLRTIHLIRTARENHLELTLIASSLLEKYLKDPEFAVRDDIDNVEKDEEVLRARLRGACGGLIESHEYSRFYNMHTLDYIHRSVPEMFQAGELSSDKLVCQMDAALNGVDSINCVSQLSFASLRLSMHKIEKQFQRMTCKFIASMRLKHNIDKPPYHFLDYMNSWVGDTWLDHHGMNQGDAGDYCKQGLPLNWEIHLHEFVLFPTHLAFKLQSQHRPEPRPRLPYNHMCIAAHANNEDFVQWKLENDPSVVDTPIKRALIGQALLFSKLWHRFFQYNAFDCHSVLPLVPYALCSS
ncbi:hypothetical protein FGRMN_9564 [Fusarium graminum]|nr:hypothetical protein FGRMN_9564 [Fusarium graminum]